VATKGGSKGGAGRVRRGARRSSTARRKGHTTALPARPPAAAPDPPRLGRPNLGMMPGGPGGGGVRAAGPRRQKKTFALRFAASASPLHLQAPPPVEGGRVWAARSAARPPCPLWRGRGRAVVTTEGVGQGGRRKKNAATSGCEEKNTPCLPPPFSPPHRPLPPLSPAMSRLSILLVALVAVGASAFVSGPEIGGRFRERGRWAAIAWESPPPPRCPAAAPSPAVAPALTATPIGQRAHLWRRWRE
jgi:hypothetical protein